MVLLYLAAGILVLALLISYIAYRMSFYVASAWNDSPYKLPSGEQYQKEREKMTSLIRAMEDLEYETISINARDGKRLYARYYHVQDGAPLQIQIHGYHGNPLRDFCGGHKIAREAGHNTLVIDQRCHGKSDGHTITFGIRERQDCLCWIHYALDRFGKETQIFLSGVSMGAATVLMASELDLPKNVIGIIADCPYSSPEAIIRKVSKDMGLPPKVMFPFVRLGARIYGRFNINEASAVTAVRNAKVPILLLHGDDDRFVPCDMSQEIFDACKSRKRLEYFSGAGHAISYIVETEKYEKIVSEFIEECMEHAKEETNAESDT